MTFGLAADVIDPSSAHLTLLGVVFGGLVVAFSAALVVHHRRLRHPERQN